MKISFHHCALFLLIGVLSTGCLDWWPEIGIPAGEKPWAELNPIQDMHKTFVIKDQSEGMRLPPVGSVPTNFAPNTVAHLGFEAASQLENPVMITEESLRYGKFKYETTCIVCHGDDGAGHGYVVPAYPQPPDLNTPRVMAWTDGQLYHVITYGQGRMWGYKNALREEERWAIVNYMRALQRAQFPEPTDLERLGEL